MSYPFIAIALIVIFFGYILYLALIKKDYAKIKKIFLLGFIFMVVWVVILYFLLR